MSSSVDEQAPTKGKTAENEGDDDPQRTDSITPVNAGSKPGSIKSDEETKGGPFSVNPGSQVGTIKSDEETKGGSPDRENRVPSSTDSNDLQVQASRGTKDRSIKISWKKETLGSEVSYFLVYLKSGENSEKIGECKVDKTKNNFYFEKLKSDTNYVAHVETIEADKQIISTKVSSPVSTNKICRDQEFDIITKGKPVITSCAAVGAGNGQIKSSLSWILPDLKKERINFECIQVRAFVTKLKEGSTRETLEVENNICAKPIFLEQGMSYKFEITCTYKDLDSFDLKCATATQTLHTDIGTPVITKIKWNENNIIVEWRPAEGAIKHTLSVINIDTEEILHQEEKIAKPKHTLKMSDSLGYGMTYMFVINATGKNQKENKVEKTELIGGDRVCTEVKARKDTKCPSRAIKLAWESPRSKPKKYKVKIFPFVKNQGKGNSRKMKIEVFSLSYTFKNLKANEKYVCKVCPIYEGDAKGITASSNQLHTEESKGKPEFNIKLAGKPKIQTCEALQKNGKYESLFKWELPDIGEEVNNYITEKIEAFVTLKDKKQLLVLENTYTEAKPISLKFGESYKFCVKCTYRDLDSDKYYELEDSRSLHTDIGTPVISDIKWRGSNIIVQWKPAEGAVKHVLSVINDATKTTIHEKIKIDDSDHTFKMSDNCGYGMTCSFVIDATGGKQKSSKAEKKILIGGNNVCTEIIARKSLKCPRRAVELTWDPPRDLPIRYNVQILEYGKDNLKENFEAVEATFHSYTFENLKAETVYICKVCPLYKDRKIGYFSSSNHLQTDRRVVSAIEKLDNFGKPEYIEEGIVSGVKLIFEISWGAVQLGENFELSKYHIDVYEPGRFKNTYHLREDCKPSVTKIQTLSLKPGKPIKVDLITTYTDLDNSKELTTSKSHSFSTQPNKPQFKKCRCENEDVILSWEPVAGAQKYHVAVENLESHNVRNTTPIEETCEIKFKISDELCYGKSYKFTISADLNGIKSEPTSETYLLGGDHAVTNVVLTKDQSVPRRSVVVKWNSPENVPKGYQIELYQVDEDSKNLVNQKSTEGHIKTLKFTELKTATTYLCKVSPKYQEIFESGTFSNLIKTDKRIILDLEGELDYGTPQTITDDARSNNQDDSSVEISWGVVKFGENHKIDKFHITVSNDETQIFVKDLSPESNKVNILKVKNGKEYEVFFTTMLMDLDNYTIQNKTKRHIFHSKTNSTNVFECDTKEGLVIFKWKAVDGVNSYELLVKDEFLSERLLLRQKIEDAELLINQIQEVRVEKSEQLRIGRTCMTKIIVYGNGPKSESDWKPHLIGGDLVPRNVKAKEYAANPERCIQITFDAPKVGEADEYKVIPIPGSKIHQSDQRFKNSPVVVEYLRRGTEYSFQVSARHGEKWSEMSLSNFLTTNQGTRGTSAAVQPASDNKGQVIFDNRKAIITGGTYITNINKGADFGHVSDIYPLIENRDDKDLLELKWTVPAFGNNASDYKVERYEIEIGKINESSKPRYNEPYVRDQQRYCLEGKEVKLGQTYEISISTKYIDIDEDEEYTSSAVKKTFVTRPCKPEITKNSMEYEKLTLEWNYCAGANYYVVKLFVDGSEYKVDRLKNTVYERLFDENFGFGKTYHVEIDAIGSENKNNCSVSESITIGEDHVPKDVVANIDHEKVTDPSTQVYLEWKSPEKFTDSYEVMLSNGAKCCTTFHSKTGCVVSELNAGTYYIFKIIAVHKDVNNIEKKSGGCLSSKIKTSPKPNRVQNVQTKPGPNPCTSIVVEWDAVKTKENDVVQYRVIVMTVTEEVITEVETAERLKIIDRLQPNTSYVTTVAGGNSAGFGINSAKLLFITATGKPKKVALLKSGTAASTELILMFPEMEEKPEKYFGKLYEGQMILSDFREVTSGHVYKDLCENTSYSVELYAEFKNGEKGIIVKSDNVKTAPGKPRIIQYGCFSDNKSFSSKDLFFKWETVREVSYYQARIIFERNGGTEKEMIITENELAYSCKNESCKYSVQVRAKTEEFGDWSDKKLIDLGPPVLHGITVELEYSDDTNEPRKNFIIQCNKSKKYQLNYCMQALCDGKKEGKAQKIEHQSIADDNVQFRYLPNEAAKTYAFDLWAELNGLEGEKAKSSSVISKPEKVTSVLATPTKDYPSTKINISWDAVKLCTGYEMMIRRANSVTCECLKKLEIATCEYEYICSQPGDEYAVFVRCFWKNTTGDWSDASKVRLEPPVMENIIVKYDTQQKKGNFKIECKKIPGAESNYCMQAFCNGEKEGPIEKKDHANINGDVVNFGYTPKRFAELYSFDLWAEVGDDFKGKSARSDTVISKPGNVKNVVAKPDADDPSVKITITWNEVARCSAYELWVQCIDSPTRECLITVTDTCHQYTCCRPGDEYFVCVRGLRESIAGDWSDNVEISMEPPPLQNIEAVQDTQNNTIYIKCKSLQSHIPLKYCMCVLGDVGEGKVEKNYENINGVIKFCYQPQKYAEKYTFQLWCEKHNGLTGIKAFSNSVISRPEKVQTVLLKLDEDNPSFGLNINWICVARCDVYDVGIYRTISEEPECVIKVERKNNCEYNCKIPGETYIVRVRGSYEHCAAEWSENAHVCLAPSRIRNVEINITANPNVVNVTWKPLETPPTRYVVALYQDDKMITEETTTKTQHKFDDKIKPGCVCFCTVAAENDGGRGKPQLSQRYHSAPTEIQNLMCKQEDGYITYEWDAPELAPDKYLLKWRVNNECPTDESTEDTFFKRPLVKGARLYELRVVASNMAGRGKMAKKEFQMPVPAMVKNVRYNLENGNIIYEWDAPESAPDEYLVKWNVDNGSTTDELTEDTKIKKRLVKGAKSYELSVAAINIAGRGNWTKMEYLMTVPDMIKEVTSNQEDGFITFEWILPQSESRIDGYLVQWKINNDQIKEESTGETKFQMFSSKPAHSYNLRVKAFNIAGCGEMSEWNTFITAPLPPRNMTVTPDQRNPQTSFLVKYEDDIDPLKKYKVTAVTAQDKRILASETTKELHTRITGLKPGQCCQMKVQTIYRGKMSIELFHT